MKKVIVSSCFLLLISFLSNQSNLYCIDIESSECCMVSKNIEKMISDPSKLDAKLKQIKNRIMTLIFLNSTLKEKTQLLGFLKHEGLFIKLFSELIINCSQALDIEVDKIQALAMTLNINNVNIDKSTQKSVSLSSKDQTQAQALTEKLLVLSEKQLYIAIQKIAHFLKLEYNKTLINRAELRDLLIQALKPLTPTELKSLDDIISKPVFEKLVNTLEEVVEITIRILSNN